MSKYAATAVLDALLDKIATGVVMTVCSTQPTSYAQATSTYKLASVSMSGGDFTKAAGSPSGRQVTVGSKSGVSVTASGSAQHVAICDGSTLLYVTTLTAQALTSGNTVTIPSWIVTVTDPS